MNKSQNNTQMPFNTQITGQEFSDLNQAMGWANQEMIGRQMASIQIKPFQAEVESKEFGVAPKRITKYLVTIIFRVPLDKGVRKS
jgi:hypothetical protein